MTRRSTRARALLATHPDEDLALDRQGEGPDESEHLIGRFDDP